jgi:hypothetical protein
VNFNFCPFIVMTTQNSHKTQTTRKSSFLRIEHTDPNHSERMHIGKMLRAASSSVQRCLLQRTSTTRKNASSKSLNRLFTTNENRFYYRRTLQHHCWHQVPILLLTYCLIPYQMKAFAISLPLWIAIL